MKMDRDDQRKFDAARAALKELPDSERTATVKVILEGFFALCRATEQAEKIALKNKERIYVARGGHMWGKGFTANQAADAALAAGGKSGKKARKSLDVIKLPQGAYRVSVDEMGTCRWHSMWGVKSSHDAEDIPQSEWL